MSNEPEQQLEDANNFMFTLDGREYVMENGELTVDNCMYEENDDDPTYSLVRAYWSLTTNVK